MAKAPAKASTKQASRHVLEVRLGESALLVGTLVFVQHLSESTRPSV